MWQSGISKTAIRPQGRYGCIIIEVRPTNSIHIIYHAICQLYSGFKVGCGSAHNPLHFCGSPPPHCKMLSFFDMFLSYNHEVINMVRTHPARDRIATQLGPTLTIDEIISILCRNMGLNATSWSLYTSTLDPPVHTYDPPITLQKIDQMLSTFHHRFGTIIVVSDTKVSKSFARSSTLL